MEIIFITSENVQYNTITKYGITLLEGARHMLWIWRFYACLWYRPFT